MAKPLSSASSEASSSSTFSTRRSQNSREPSTHRWNRSPRLPLSNVAPSSGVLSFLASIVSASPVRSNPIPLSFLCPSIDGEDDIDCSLAARAGPSLAHSTAHTKGKGPALSARARRIPDRFSQEADGVWRRVDSYTLYGSTMPSCASGTCTKPTGVPSSVDDQIKGPDSATDVTTSVTSKLTVDDLPVGWKPPEPRSDRTTLILAVSLVLAFLICSTIIGCLFWRKKVQKGMRDPERGRRRRRRAKEEDGEALVVEKEMKVKQKIWARATARWRANVRHSARQRRRISRISQAQQSSVSLDNSRSYLAPSVISSRASSRSSTHRASERHQNTGNEYLEHPLESTNSESSVQVTVTAAPAHPPAYQHRGQATSSDDMSSQAYSGLTPPLTHNRSRRPSHSSIAEASGLSGPHSTPLLSAHVATDDKQFLARLANMASAPPSDEALASSDLPGSVQASVPTWRDEDIDDFETCLAPHESHASAQSSISTSKPMFPPPPSSKERMASAEAFNYPYSFNDLETPDLEPSEPSAPPFEEGSAPPAPSAPPLAEEDCDADPQHPSAPEWDSLSVDESREETPGGQDHDRIPAASAPALSSLEATLTSSVQPSRDSVVLPVYRP